MPKTGEVWKVKLWHRTYWSNTTIKLLRPYWEIGEKPIGWLMQKPGSVCTVARVYKHIRFLCKL